MMLTLKAVDQRHRGAALIVSMIFVVVFIALAVSMAAMSGTNVQIADNQRKVNGAFASAQSGLDVMRYWLSHVLIPSSTAPSDYLAAVVDKLQYNLDANDISNITVNGNGSISTVALDSATGRAFNGQIRIDPNMSTVLQVYVAGSYGEVRRTIKVDFNIQPYEFPIFNYGMATKGPLNLPGNPTITGVNSHWEADIYIENGQGQPLGLQIDGNTNFDGDVYLGAGDAYFDGDVLIAGDHGQAAIDNHVFLGVEPPEFPTPKTAPFQQYATAQTIDASTDTSDNMTLTNTIIKAGANPCFEGNVQIQGILFVQAPNTVVFNGNVYIQGMIVGHGDLTNPGTNSMTFYGNFESDPLPNDSQFDDLRSEVGTCLLVPGFAVELAGNFSSLEGVMAVSGFHLSGNASAVVKGTILDFSDSPTVVEGNATLNFDRAGTIKIPAGFDLYRELEYNPSSYTEVAL